MIDFGFSDPAVAVHFDRAIAIVDGPIADLAQQFNAMAALGSDTEIVRLHSAIARGPLTIVDALQDALVAAVNAVQQIRYLAIEPGVSSSPIVFHCLMRAAIVGSARVVYVLHPASPDDRRDRAAAVLGQDVASGTRALEHYTQFGDALAGVRAPQALLTNFIRQRDDLRQQQPRSHDGGAVAGMTEAIIDALSSVDVLAETGIDHQAGADLLRDHAHWLWNTYSGLAHGYSWPRVLWRIADPRFPGDFPMDLHHVATCTQVALVAYLARAAPGSANTSDPVDLNSGS